jgi:hypothetical protein
MVDLRTGLTHLLTPDAADAGLVALCGRPVLPGTVGSQPGPLGLHRARDAVKTRFRTSTQSALVCSH